MWARYPRPLILALPDTKAENRTAMGPHCTAPTKTASQNILPELRLAGRHRERDRLSFPAVSSTKLTQTPADMSYSGVVWQFLKLLQDLSPFFQARELYPRARRHIMGMARLIKHSSPWDF